MIWWRPSRDAYSSCSLVFFQRQTKKLGFFSVFTRGIQVIHLRRMRTAPNWGVLLTLLVLALSGIPTVAGKGLCRLENGKCNIRVDLIVRGEKGEPQIIPEELPVTGEPDTEIALNYDHVSYAPFKLRGKRLQVVKPFTKGDTSAYVFELECTVLNVLNGDKKRLYAVIVKVSDSFSERLPEQLPLSEWTKGEVSLPDEGENCSQTARDEAVRVAKVIFDTFPYTTMITMTFFGVMLGAAIVVFIHELLALWKVKKQIQRVQKPPDSYGFTTERTEEYCLNLGPGMQLPYSVRFENQAPDGGVATGQLMVFPEPRPPTWNDQVLLSKGRSTVEVSTPL